ncbi:hypothetical protein FVEG_17218 [Fusarium verticillioides 7600]|uniref:Uncharacterized protein n=1 Tax=Gibberella moniliformis (strain M3125 / FGSC 7600) TaxID=334819 RepID=W7N1H0_GIBM7|nr:hypothetical protein FVEG_17218 [Fusarium verticillioides 7600]EWG54000.1 hypothetical protein FVEG_17218 [Fusarium verticillioides 7600]
MCWLGQVLLTIAMDPWAAFKAFCFVILKPPGTIPVLIIRLLHWFIVCFLYFILKVVPLVGAHLIRLRDISSHHSAPGTRKLCRRTCETRGVTRQMWHLSTQNNTLIQQSLRHI